MLALGHCVDVTGKELTYMWHPIAGPWPWYVGGPLIGLFVPVLLLLGNKQLGLSGSLRAICAAVAPGRVEFFRYDWKASGLWNIALAAGLLLGAGLAVAFTAVSTPDVSPATHAALTKLGLDAVSGLDRRVRHLRRRRARNVCRASAALLERPSNPASAA